MFNEGIYSLWELLEDKSLRKFMYFFAVLDEQKCISLSGSIFSLFFITSLKNNRNEYFLKYT